MSKKRSFTIEEKLAIIHKTRQSNNSIRKVGKEKGINESTISGWISKENEMKQMLQDKTIQIRAKRRIFGGGIKAQFADLENQLISWVRERNDRGLTVKKYIIANAKFLIYKIWANN